MDCEEVPDLADGFDASNEADIDNTPSGSQAHHQPPLNTPISQNVWSDIQCFSVPEIVHWSALLTFFHILYKNMKHL